MTKRSEHFYDFGPFRVDETDRLLWRDGEVVPLTPKAFEMLLALVENSGHLLTKEALLKRVWPDTVVEEANLSHNIYKLREALGEGAGIEKYIATVPRRGYRFVAEVVELRDQGEDVLIEEHLRAHVVIEEESNDILVPTTPAAPNPQPTLAPSNQMFRSTRRRKTLLVVSLALLLLGGATMGVWSGWLKRTPLKNGLGAIPLGAEVTITRVTNSGKSGAASISPDGKLIAYMQNSFAGTGCLYVRQIGSNHEIQLLEPGERTFGGTGFSGDGEFIYYVIYDAADPGGALFRIRALGGPPVRLLGNFNSMFSLSPDGRRVAYYRDDPSGKLQNLVLAQLDGAGEQVLLTRAYTEEVFDGIPAWSPDGSVIALGLAAVQNVDNHEPTMIYGIDVASGEIKPLSDQHWAEIGRMIWKPDGRGLIFVADSAGLGNQIYYLSYPDGEVRRITNGLHGFGNYGLGITADSNTLVADSWESSAQLWKVGADGDTGRAVPLTNGDDDGRRGLAEAADGRVIYVAREGGEYDFWHVKEDGIEAGPLTADSFSDRQIAATADGRHLVFTSDRAGGSHIFRADADGSHPQQLTTGESEDITPDCSPDGQWVVYASLKNHKSRLWRVSIEGGNPIQVGDYECVAPAFSPDGKFISCIVPSEGRAVKGSIDVISAFGGPLVKQFNVVPFEYSYLSPRWTPDGRALIFPKEENQVSNLWRQPISGDPPQQLTDFKTDIIFNFTYTRDGRNVILSRGHRTVDVVRISNFK